MQKSSVGILIKDKKVLFVRRSFTTRSFPGYWCLPGGLVEPGEDVKDAATREIKEETDLDFSPTELYNEKYSDSRDGCSTYSYRFLGDFSGEVRLDEEESTGYAWICYEDKNDFKFAYDNLEILESLHKNGLI